MTGTAEELAPLSADHVHDITREVWASFLGLDLEPWVADSWSGLTLSGVVGISGAWQGTVALECPMPHAVAAAEAMFAADPGTLTPEEVADALGELTNMVGGNIKSLLPAPSALSTPSVAEGRDVQLFVPGAELVEQVHLIGPDALVRVSVFRCS